MALTFFVRHRVVSLTAGGHSCTPILEKPITGNCRAAASFNQSVLDNVANAPRQTSSLCEIMKPISLYTIYLISCLSSLAESRLHSVYVEEPRALVSFLKTENKNEIEFVRVCLLNESNDSELKIYARSATHSGKEWTLSRGHSISYDTEKNEPIRLLKFESRALAELQLPIGALFKKSETHITYFLGVHVFRSATDENKSICIIQNTEEEFIFLSANEYKVSEEENPTRYILTLIDGELTRNPFENPTESINYDFLDFRLPIGAVGIFQPTKPNKSIEEQPIQPRRD